MKQIYTLLGMLLTVMGIAAAPRTADQARSAAKQLLSRHAARKAPGHTATVDCEPQLVAQAERAEGGAYYYVFSGGTDEGYALISGDDRLPAVIGFTERGDYNESETPAALTHFLEQYRAFLDNATAEQIREVSAFKAQAKHAAVEPFVKTKWDQREPYNRMCPSYNNQRCLTGCVATAVAQVLKFYGCPTQLKAAIPAYNTPTFNLRQSAIEAGTSYDWANMRDAYTGAEGAAEANAVAKLMYHVGCALSMDYGTGASSASLNPTILTNCFGLDKETTRAVSRFNYDLAAWDDMLYGELAAHRPVLYSGQSSGGGHEFVIHGYEDGLYQVNWGWGGMSDGYFDITILNPGNSGGAGASTTGDGYNYACDMVIGLQPDNGVVDKIEPVAGKTDKVAAGALSATVALNAGSKGLSAMTNTIDVTVKNSGEAEYYGAIYVMSSTTSVCPDKYTCRQGATVPGKGSVTFSFTYTAKEPGTVNFWVLDEYAKEIGKGSITFAAEEAPRLTLVSVKLATPKTKRGYHKFQGKNVEMDEVAGLKADFDFEVRNDGGYYEGDYPIYYYNAAVGKWYEKNEHLSFAANATTTITLTAGGSQGDVVGAWLRSYEGVGEITVEASALRHLTDDGYVFDLTESEIAYLTGTATAVTAPHVNSEASAAPCYNLNGQRVNATARGIIIRNGRKTLRR